MKPFFTALWCALLGSALAACSHIEIKPESNPDRVLSGTINLAAATELPANAVVTVRLTDQTQSGQPPTVIAEQNIAHSATLPIPFRLEYHADEATLRRGLNLDVRISIGG